MSKKKIGIVTPVFNSTDFIERTLKSIRNAAVFSKEKCDVYHYIIDGGSTDGTVDKINTFIKKNKIDSYFVYVISETDAGMYDALAKGFRLLHNIDIYGYLNAGDIYSEYCFDILVEEFKNDVDWLTGLQVAYSQKGEIIASNLPLYYDSKLISMGFYGTLMRAIQQESTFWSASAHELIDLNELRSFKYAGDFYIWYTLSNACFRLNIIKVWLGGFSFMEGQLSSIYNKEYVAEINQVKNKADILSYMKCLIFRFAEYIPDSLKVKLNTRIKLR